MVNSRQKGKSGELAWRDVLRENGYSSARRGQQFSGTETTEDVVGGPVGFHCEVKVREKHNAWGHMQQAEHDSGGRAVPYVAMKMNRKPWLVVLRAEDFLRLARLVEGAAAVNQRKELPRVEDA
jgi:Holliday junction resolvase